MSKDVIKSTARKLKYYMEIKRLEDGFDLSGPELPRQRYPTKKPRPTLQYDGLHDRSLKHYFHDPEIKQHLNTLNSTYHETDKEQRVKTQVRKHMKNSKFRHPYLPEGLYVPAKPPKPKSNSRSFSATRPYSAGATKRKKQGTLRGGSVLLRSRPSSYITRGEAERLINTATKLLVATLYGIQHDDDDESLPYIDGTSEDGSRSMNRYGYASDTSTRDSSQMAVKPRPKTATGFTRRPDRPKSAKGPRPRPVRPSSAKFAYDLSGRKYRIERVDNLSPKYTTYDASGSEAEDNVSEYNGRYNGMRVLVPTKGSSKHLPEWLAVQRAKADDEDSEMSDKKKKRRRPRKKKIEGDFVQADMCTQTAETHSTQTISYDEAKFVQTTTDSYAGKDFTDSGAQATVAITQTSAQTTEVPGVSTQADLPKPIHDPDAYLENLKHGPRLKSGRRVIYEITVVTGTRLGASTKADVHITMYGSKGNSGKIKLKQAKAGGKLKFQKGQTDVFKVDTYHVGKLECVEIGHDRKELGMGWFLDRVIIREDEEKAKYEFKCGRWMSAMDDDSRTIRVLPLTDIEYMSSSESETETETQTEPESVVEKSVASTHFSQPSDTDGNISETTATNTQVNSSSDSDSDDSTSIRVVRVKRKDAAPSTTTATSGSSGSESSESESSESESSASDTETQTDTAAETDRDDRKESRIKTQSGNGQAPPREGVDTLGVHEDESHKGAKEKSDSDSDTSRQKSLDQKQPPSLPTIEEKERESRTSVSSASSSSSSSGSSSSSSSSSESGSESESERDAKRDKRRSSSSSSDSGKSRSGSESESDRSKSSGSESESEEQKRASTSRETEQEKSKLNTESDSSQKRISSTAGSESEDQKPQTSTETESTVKEKSGSGSESGSVKAGKDTGSGSESGSIKAGRETGSGSESGSVKADKGTGSGSESGSVKASRDTRRSDSESHTDSESDSETTSGSISSSDSRSGSGSDSGSSSGSDTEVEEARQKRSDLTPEDIPPRPTTPTPPHSSSSVVSETKEDKGDIFMEGFKAGIKAQEEAAEKTVSEKSTDKDEEEEDRKIRRGPTIHEATKNGDLDRVKALVARNKSLVNEPDEVGRTPLHIAAEHNQLDILKWLPLNGADINHETRTGYTCMHTAALSGHVRCMNALSVMGASVRTKTFDDQTPLHLAAMSGHLETAKWLVANRAPLEDQDNMGRTALDIAEDYNHQEVVKFLKACEADLKREDSGIAQLRSPRMPEEQEQAEFTNLMASKQTTSDSAASWTDDKDTVNKGGRKRRDSQSSTGSSTGSSSGSSSGSETERSNDKRRGRRVASDSQSITSSGSSSGSDSGSVTRTESETDVKRHLPEKMKKQEDTALKERQKSFKEHHEKMQETGTSFLDAIRMDYENDEQQQ
ncbi:dentin sialophosphoprotein-like isoform X2 [Ptychodera flava]|uniref:dentin sialophosphoprotein-like isoform X2 n=1 Tax=Ptychodera flava TaxID=63121 RepID=UPI00396AB157